MDHVSRPAPPKVPDIVVNPLCSSVAVFGSSSGCGEIQTCATPNVTATEYRVLWDPARVEFVGETSWASTQTEMGQFRARTCLDP